MKISVIVPVFNEAATVLQVLTDISRQSIEDVEFEVIVVDDGSTDNSRVMLEANSGLYAKLVTHPVNRGKGAAVKSALAEATGEYLLFQDADLEYSPDDYENLLHPIAAFGAEMVIGSRFGSPRYTRVHYFWHKVGNHLLTFIFNALYNTTFSDIYCGYLVLRRELVDAAGLTVAGWAQHAEILAKAVKRTKVIYEVPVGYRGRSYEEGKKIRAVHIVPVIWTIIRLRFKPG